jgi:hypothetical protein
MARRGKSHIANNNQKRSVIHMLWRLSGDSRLISGSGTHVL